MGFSVQQFMSRKFVTTNHGFLAIMVLTLLSKVGVDPDLLKIAVGGIVALGVAYIGGNVASKKYAPEQPAAALVIEKSDAQP